MEDEVIKAGLSIFKHLSDEIALRDDAGAVRLNEEWLILTNDMFVESTDFVPAMTPEDVGFKVVTMNVSDVLAMGAKPKFFAFSIGFKRGTNMEFIRGIFDGIEKALSYYGMKILSADTNESKELVIDGIAIGMAKKLLLRRNAKPNQLVCVTGEFGRPLCALKIILDEAKIEDSIAKILFRKLVRPYARLEEGLKLSNFSNCAIDVSDGLSKELRIIAEMSDVGLIIHEDKIPVSREVRLFCEKNDLNAVDVALNSGEEFELLFTIDREMLNKLDFDFTVIGEVVEECGVWLKKGEKLVELEDKGWRHII